MHSPDATSHRYLVRFARGRTSRGERLFLKVYGPDHPDVRVEWEARALRTAAGTMDGQTGHAVPTVVACHPALRALLMEYTPGVPLARTLARSLWWARYSARGRRRLAEYAARAGGLLAAFQGIAWQQLTSPPTAAELLARYGRDFGRRLDRLAARLEPALLRPLRGAFERLAVIDVSQHRPLVAQHSDFGPWNVLVRRSGGLVVVDLANFCAGWPEYDVAYFWTALESYSRFRSIPGPLVAAAQRALQNGYLAAGGCPISLDVFRCFHAMHVAYLAAALPLTHAGARTTLLYRPAPTLQYIDWWVRRCLNPAIESWAE